MIYLKLYEGTLVNPSKLFFFESNTTIYANHFLLFFRTKKLKSIKELAQKEIDEYKLAQEKIFRQKVQAKQNEIEDGFKQK